MTICCLQTLEAMRRDKVGSSAVVKRGSAKSRVGIHHCKRGSGRFAGVEKDGVEGGMSGHAIPTDDDRSWSVRKTGTSDIINFSFFRK